MGSNDDAIIESLRMQLEAASRVAKELNMKYPKFYGASNYLFKALLEVERIQKERKKFERLATKSLKLPQNKRLGVSAIKRS